MKEQIKITIESINKIYPDNEKYAITIMFNDKGNLIEWYFDIAKNIGIEKGIPFEEDLYLDMVIMPNGQKAILDEDELLDALNRGDITQVDFEVAYSTLRKLENKYANNLGDLINLTKKFCEIFSIKNWKL